MQLARLIQQLFLHIHRNDLGQEHIMAAQRDDLPDLTFQRQRALGDDRGGEL